MTLTFLTHQLKAFWRSKNKGRGIAMRIVMGVLILYLLLNVLVVAFFLDKIIGKTHPDQNIIQVFNGFILYYFLLDLLTRFQMQELPTLAVRPYLHLPIKRNQIVNYLSISSLGTAFNLTPFLLTIPFLSKIVIPQFGAGVFWGYVLCIIGLTFFNHFFSLWLKRKVNLSAAWMLGFFGLLLALGILDFYIELISISALSNSFFTAIATQPLLSIATILLATGMFFINHNFLKANLYLEELHTSNTAHKSSTEIPFLDRFGVVGDLTANELKLIIRNKRPRSVLTMCLFFLLYGLIFYSKPGFADYTILFCGMFMTGIFIINYGQFMFSWQSSHFDGLLVSPVNAKDFFKSKFLLFSLFSTVCFVLTIPYVYFGWRVLMIHAVMYVWNLGVNTLLVLYFANQNYKRIDLGKAATFNWEGVGASQWILSIPLLIGPFLVYLPFRLTGFPNIGIAAVGIIGLIFIITREYWLNKLVDAFKEKRYTIAEGFRNK